MMKMMAVALAAVAAAEPNVSRRQLQTSCANLNGEGGVDVAVRLSLLSLRVSLLLCSVPPAPPPVLFPAI